LATPVTWPIISASFWNTKIRVLDRGERVREENQLILNEFAPCTGILVPEVNKIDRAVKFRSGHSVPWFLHIGIDLDEGPGLISG